MNLLLIFLLGSKKCVHMPPKRTLNNTKMIQSLPFYLCLLYLISNFQIQHPKPADWAFCFCFGFFKCHFAKYQFSQHWLTVVRNEVQTFFFFFFQFCFFVAYLRGMKIQCLDLSVAAAAEGVWPLSQPEEACLHEA